MEGADDCLDVEDCDVPEVRQIEGSPAPALLQTEIAAGEAGERRLMATRGPVLGGDPHHGPVTADSRLMAVHFINVGQGAAALLEFPCGAVLVDTGGEEEGDFESDDKLREYLEDFFSRRSDLSSTLDLVVLTHPHIDHTRGVAVLEALQRDMGLTIRNVLDNGERLHGSGISGQKKLATLTSRVEAIREMDIPSLDGKTDTTIDPLNCGSVDPLIRVLWGHLDSRPDMNGDGRSDWPESEWSTENNHSVVLRVDFGKSSFLFPGDIQRAASDSIAASYAARLKTLDVDVVVVPHHGSENGLTANLLAAISPRIAVIQAGESTRLGSNTADAYGHPRKKIVDLLVGPRGVTGRRREVTVPVATATHRFIPFTLDKAVFSNSWDGTVIVYANTTGRMQVVTESNE